MVQVPQLKTTCSIPSLSRPLITLLPTPQPIPLNTHIHCMIKQLLLISIDEISLFHFGDSSAMDTVLSDLSGTFSPEVHALEHLRQPG